MATGTWYGVRPRKGHVTPQRDAERVLGQIERGEVRADAEAAREIAQRIEAQGGFWDLEQKRAQAKPVTAPGALVHRLPRHLSLVHINQEHGGNGSAVA